MHDRSVAKERSAGADRLDREKVRAAALLAVAMALVGLAYGALAVGAGLPVWVAPLLGVIVLAGSAEMLYVGLATAASPWVALPAALLINVRHIPYGMAMRPYLGTGLTRLWRAHVVNDESVAFALGEKDPAQAEKTFTLAGVAVLIGWPIGALTGSILGRGIDQAALGLDAIFPAVILALVIPALKRARLRAAIIVAAIVAIPAALYLPAGIAPVAGLIALPIAVWRVRDITSNAAHSDEPGGEAA